MSRWKMLVTLYMAFWSFIIGTSLALYLILVNWVINIFWKYIPAWFNIPSLWQPLMICLPLSVIIGLSQKYIGAYPLTIAQVLNEIKITGHFDFHRWKQILFSGLLILGAGASIGPEASASGLAAGMMYWLGCHYKMMCIQQKELVNSPLREQLQMIWLAKLSNNHVSHPITDFFQSKHAKQLFYFSYTLIGLCGFIILFSLFPQEGVLGFHHPAIDWDWHGLLIVIPAIVFGWLAGFVFVKISKISEQWLDRNQYTISKAIMGGILLIIAATFSQDLLFSGEFSIVNFSHSALKMSPLFLLTFALLKAIITNAGFSLGWRGGTIFPAIFSLLATGACLAHYLPWMPQLTVTLLVAAGLTIILEQPIITAILIWFLLPIQFGIFVLIVCLFVKWITQKFPVLKP